MPEPTTYTFNHQELVEVMIKAAGIHEGKWMLLVNFGFSAGNVGHDDVDVSPAAFTVVNHIGLSKAKADSPPSLVVDAADVNPRPE